MAATSPLTASLRAEVDKLAHRIALATSVSDIEVHCTWVLIDGTRWYDSRVEEPEDRDMINEAIRYLDLRGKLIRHPEQPHLVRGRR